MPGVRASGATSRNDRHAALEPGSATREIILQDPGLSARWHIHDYPSIYARWNYHPEYEIHLIRSSAGHFIVGDFIGVFHPGQVVLVGPNLPHNWMSDWNGGDVVAGRDVAFQFRGAWLSACQELLPELRSLDRLMARAERGVEYLGATSHAAAQELMAIGSSSGARRVSHIFGLFDILCSAPRWEQRLLSGAGIAPPGDPEAMEIINRTIDYILQNLSGRVLLSRASRLASMSDPAFSRYFKNASGQTFSQVVRKLRVARACRDLKFTVKPVSRIAHESGYANLANFNRQFRAEMGMTPSQYRRSS